MTVLAWLRAGIHGNNFDKRVYVVKILVWVRVGSSINVLDSTSCIVRFTLRSWLGARFSSTVLERTSYTVVTIYVVDRASREYVVDVTLKAFAWVRESITINRLEKRPYIVDITLNIFAWVGWGSISPLLKKRPTLWSLVFVALVVVVVEHAALVDLGESNRGGKFVHLHRSHPTCYARRSLGNSRLPFEISIQTNTPHPAPIRCATRHQPQPHTKPVSVTIPRGRVR